MEQSEFIIEAVKVIDRAVIMSEKVRKEGLLAIEDDIDREKLVQRDIFELGMCLLVDGHDYNTVDKILTLIMGHTSEHDIFRIKSMQKDAVLSIQAGDNISILYLLLTSRLNNQELGEVLKISPSKSHYIGQSV